MTVVASILPTSSALAMPVRMALGAAEPWQVGLAVLVLIGGVAVLIPLSGPTVLRRDPADPRAGETPRRLACGGLKLSRAQPVPNTRRNDGIGNCPRRQDVVVERLEREGVSLPVRSASRARSISTIPTM